jgi:hypothetical protein
MISEKQLIPSLRLTVYQKKVLAKIVASPTKRVAGEEVSTGVQIVAARDALLKVDPSLITFIRGEAALTPIGKKVATDENIIDETGALTDTGKDLAYDKEETEPLKTESFQLLASMNKIPTSDS